MQGDRRVLATDEWLRVKGCETVYALGDCATVDQKKIMVYNTPISNDSFPGQFFFLHPFC